MTPNPALDRTIGVGALQPGGVHRARWVGEVAGGKGLNVARAAIALGADVRACGPLGGASGDRLRALAAEERIDASWVGIAGPTRTCTIVVETSGSATVVNEPGPTLSDAEWSALLTAVRELAGAASVVTISGSSPGGDADRIADLVRAAAAGGAPVWVDASGAELAAVVAAGDLLDGSGLKVNLEEARGVVGDLSPCGAARALLASAGCAVVTDGANGAAAADACGVWWCPAPRVAVANATGSGDAFLAGLVCALADGLALPDALVCAVAAGSAAAMMPTAVLPAACRNELLAVMPPATTCVDTHGDGPGEGSGGRG